MKKSNTLIRKGLRFIAVLIPAMVMIFAMGAQQVKAEAPAPSIISVDYSRSTLTVQLDERDHVLFMSDKNQKTWEFVPVTKNASNQVILDISWVTLTSDYTISLKGDYSATPVKQVIKKQVTNFKATYDLANNRIKFTNRGTGTVQWRKKDGFTWNTISESMIEGNETAAAFGDTLMGLCSNGASLIFRLAPDADNRASKEVTVNITRKTAAPIVSVNDQYMAIKVEKGMQYRYADKNGNPMSAWTDISKSEYVPLEAIAANAILNKAQTNETKDVYIQFRTKATSGKQISNISTVKIPAQSAMSETVKSSIEIAYTSSTTFDIKIPSASTETPYEYCIINQSALLDGVKITDFEEVTWKKVTTTKVSISSAKDNVKDGSLVYVRKAAKESAGHADYQIATPYIMLSPIDYPDDISTGSEGLTWLQTVAGVCTKENTEGYITFTMKSPTDSKISEIEFVDYKTSASRATLRLSNNDFKCTVTDNGAKSEARYLLSVTIMDTSAIDKFAADDSTRRFLANITLQDSTEAFKSSLEKGIALLILPASKAVNPSGATETYDKKDIADKLGWKNDKDGRGNDIYNMDKDVIRYTTAFTRVYKSDKDYVEGDLYYGVDGNYDASEFRVKLNLGTRYVAAKTTTGNVVFTENPVAVEKLKIDGVYINLSTYPNAYKVEYANTENDDGEPTRMAVITVNTKVIESIPQIDDRNKNIPVYIYLNNGEILDDVVTINLTETATINGGANSWAVSGRLKETDTITTTTSDSTQTTTTDHVDRTIKLTVWKEGYDVALTSVTWNGKSVATSINKDGTTISLDLSNKAINKIMSELESRESHYLTFTFNNGFTIESGWSLTLSPIAAE